MKYAPPIGSIDPNAGYVDRSGNTPGSPVPAAAIEPVMREIENVIVKAGLAPSGSDFTQLWQAIAGRTRTPATGSITVYVRTDGSDANNGLADSATGAFKTIQAAVNNIRKYDMLGYSYTVIICPGTYVQDVRIDQSHASGQPLITVKAKTPGTVIVQSTGTNYIFQVREGMVLVLSDLTVKASPGMTYSCLLAYTGAHIQFSNLIFDGTAGSDAPAVTADTTSYILQWPGTSTFKGTFSHAFNVDGNAYIYLHPTSSVTFISPFSVNCVIAAANGGVMFARSSMSGTVSGYQYKITTGGIINTNGAASSYIPGSGTLVATGGVYA